MASPLNDNHAYDARAVANLLLDVADREGVSLSNLALQKVLYFAHGLYLTAFGTGLVGGFFEAWKHGPVHPQVYGVFKAAGAGPIQFRATRRLFPSGAVVALEPVADGRVHQIAAGLIATLGKLPAQRLVGLSHAKEGPWDCVVNEARTGGGLGMRITDILISERFGRHKLAVDLNQNIGDDPVEDTPLTG